MEMASEISGKVNIRGDSFSSGHSKDGGVLETQQGYSPASAVGKGNSCYFFFTGFRLSFGFCKAIFR